MKMNMPERIWLHRYDAARLRHEPNPKAVDSGAPPMTEYVRASRLAEAEATVERLQRWSYCPECGSAKANRPNDTLRFCDDCGQDWYTDMDYTDTVRGHLAKAHTAEAREWKMREALTYIRTLTARYADADCTDGVPEGMIIERIASAALTDTASAGDVRRRALEDVCRFLNEIGDYGDDRFSWGDLDQLVKMIRAAFLDDATPATPMVEATRDAVDLICDLLRFWREADPEAVDTAEYRGADRVLSKLRALSQQEGGE